MANTDGEMIRERPDFSLPDEILSVLPTDPYDQLDLARKITSMAIASRVTNLEMDAGRLRQKLNEKDRRVNELEDKVSHLETANQEAEFRLKISRQDNMKLLGERDSLDLIVKKLTRDLAKLEAFKRQLVQSLNDENSPQTESVDIGTYEQSSPKAYSKHRSYDETNGYTFAKYHSYIGTTDSESVNENGSKQSGGKLNTPFSITPRITPTGTPRSISTIVTPRTSGATSPTTSRYEGLGSLSSWYPSSQQSSTATSPGRPPATRTPRIDGKEFFRQARSRLSLEQFSAFLANVKELNAQRQSREETLLKAEEIFGLDNKDLYVSFQRMLNRDVHNHGEQT